MIKNEKIASSEAIVQQKVSPVFEDSSEPVCPQCRHANEHGGTYCAECGAVLQQPAKCPKCNTVARPRADICEICGTWLLKGQCMFCYAYIAEGEAFCGECGNPTAGVTCQRCGKLSIFDFCKSCRIPLSIQAKDMAQATAQDPSFKEMVSLLEQLASFDDLGSVTTNMTANVEAEPKPISSTHDDQVLRLKAYREACHESVADSKPKSVPKVLFSGDQKARINQLNDEVFREEERRRELERKLKEALCKLSGKTFSSNQEARRFFMNIIAGLPEEVAKKIIDRGLGWRCNAYDCVHDSPGNCADPSRGGVWLIR